MPRSSSSSAPTHVSFITLSYNIFYIVAEDKVAQKKSLRNQFNYQERSSQTFNLPIRTKGIKTEPPMRSVFSVEAT
jgi:hypothetical protein